MKKKRRRDCQITTHHIPPRSVSNKGFTIRVPWYLHKAYHTIFGNVGSYEEACKILKKWWGDMKVICAWCGKVLQEGDEPISHGICPECKEKLLKEVK